MPLPRRIGRGAYFEVREVGRTRQVRQCDLAFLNAAFQIVHHQRRLVHVLDIELCLRARHLQAQVEPDIFRDIDCAGETWSIVDLPVAAGVENWRVLHGVGKAGLVLAEIDLFGVGAVAEMRN